MMAKVLFLLGGSREQMGENALRMRGCVTHLTDDATEAIQMLGEDQWHAVVLDLDLPGFDVLGLMGTLRGHSQTRDLTIVARADSVSDDVTALALSCGCDRLISGRLTDQQLAAEVERVLSDRPRPVPRAA